FLFLISKSILFNMVVPDSSTVPLVILYSMATIITQFFKFVATIHAVVLLLFTAFWAVNSNVFDNIMQLCYDDGVILIKEFRGKQT
ncbi:MAG TPA: hypothetical protein DCW47_10030, partial [Lachnospiraceae bacterium]|nr:hypothetical protein [Lachnospiraceae bacterium]